MKKFLTLEQVKALSLPQAEKYASYLRNILVETVEENGGHLASNLGVVEISLALVRTLDIEKDRIVFDTGHQCYVHKLLTGDRKSTRLNSSHTQKSRMPSSA